MLSYYVGNTPPGCVALRGLCCLLGTPPASHGPGEPFFKKKEKEKGNGGTPDSQGVVRRYNRSIAVGLAPRAHVCVPLCASSFVMNHM